MGVWVNFMAHKTKINGTTYDINGGSCKVNGTKYNINKGRTKINGTGYDIAFGTPVGSVPEGQVITIHENGSPIEYFVARHNYESDLNGSGGTLVFRKPTTDDEVVWDSEGNSYSGSEVDNWLNTTFLSRLSPGVTSALKVTKIESAPVNSWRAEVIERKIFLPSLLELGGSDSNAPIEGEAIPASSLIINNGEFATAFWTRSNMDNEMYMAFMMLTGGGVDERYKGAGEKVRPMFVLDSNADISNL